MTNAELSAILEKAADVVDQRGYYPRSYDCENGVCEVGALYLSITGKKRIGKGSRSQQIEQIESTVNEVCYTLHGQPWREVAGVGFQDRHFHRDGKLLSRTLREVAAKLIQDDQNKAERKEEVVAVA